MVSNVIGKENTFDVTQASGLLLKLNITKVLSLRLGIIKRLMHINEIVIWPSPWMGTNVCGLDIKNTGGLGPYEY